MTIAPTFAESQVIYRDLSGDWGSFRLIIGGKNVSHLRGIPAQLGGYQLQEPYGYGPADFSLPQVTNLEVDTYGQPGELHWLDKGKPVQLVQVQGGSRVRTVWRGFITILNPTNEGLQIHCDGDASGRLTLKDRHPALFVETKDIGLWLYDAFRLCNLTLRPYLGADTGITVDSRGRAGTYLSYTDGLLADAMNLDGTQWTILPEGQYYRMQVKDTTTVDFTCWNGAAGVELDVSSDLSEEPTSIFGTGTDPSGQVWVNGRYPGLVQGPPPPFPGTLNLDDEDGDTTTGSGISDLNWKLIGMGYLDREDATSSFNPETQDAVQDLQEDAGLPQTGSVDLATWRALYDESDTGLSLAQAAVRPLAQISAVRKWNETSNGSRSTRNPGFDRKRIEVDLTVDHGAGVLKSRAKAWSKRKLNQSENGKNWTGTLTLRTDVAVGDVTYNAVTQQGSRLDITPGMNVRVRHFDGNTLFHIAGVNVSSDLSVSLAVDTKARDLLTLGQIIERNRASRINPARQWFRQHRGTDANHAQVQWSEVGGRIFTTVNCPAYTWTVFPVVAGQAGSVERIRIQTTGSPAAFVCLATAKRIGPRYLDATIGDPFLTNSPVSSITLTNAGSGYTSAPTVTISGGGGSGARATASTDATKKKSGKVTSISMKHSGTGYTSTPTVTISGGGGSGATATASIDTNTGPWLQADVQKDIDGDRAVLGWWGSLDQPCGYHPRPHTGKDGNPTTAPITGLFLDSGGFDYHTFDQPVLYLAIYPQQDTTIPPQRIMWPVLEAGS